MSEASKLFQHALSLVFVLPFRTDEKVMKVLHQRQSLAMMYVLFLIIIYPVNGLIFYSSTSSLAKTKARVKTNRRCPTRLKVERADNLQQSSAGNDVDRFISLIPSNLVTSSSSGRTWTQRKPVLNDTPDTTTTTDDDGIAVVHIATRKQAHEFEPSGRLDNEDKLKDVSMRVEPIQSKRREFEEENQKHEKRWFGRPINSIENRKEPQVVFPLRDQNSRQSTTSSINDIGQKKIQQPPRRRRREKMKPMPVVGYDSESIEEYYDLRPFEVGWRLNSLGLPLLGRFVCVMFLQGSVV
jgi:hypothetical protein